MCFFLSPFIIFFIYIIDKYSEEIPYIATSLTTLIVENGIQRILIIGLIKILTKGPNLLESIISLFHQMPIKML